MRNNFIIVHWPVLPTPAEPRTQTRILGSPFFSSNDLNLTKLIAGNLSNEMTSALPIVSCVDSGESGPHLNSSFKVHPRAFYFSFATSIKEVIISYFINAAFFNQWVTPIPPPNSTFSINLLTISIMKIIIDLLISTKN